MVKSSKQFLAEYTRTQSRIFNILSVGNQLRL